MPPVDPTTPEPLVIVLTRMEGTLNLVADRVSNLLSRMDRAETTIAELKSNVHTITIDRDNEKRNREELARILAEGERERRLELEEKRAAEEAKWSPRERILSIGVGISSIVSAYLAYKYQLTP
jgi:hypothetical protein